jgi:hypothetical protein
MRSRVAVKYGVKNCMRLEAVKVDYLLHPRLMTMIDPAT